MPYFEKYGKRKQILGVIYFRGDPHTQVSCDTSNFEASQSNPSLWQIKW